MITIGESIQRVLSIYSRGVQSKDSRLTSRHVYSALLSARAELIRQSDVKGKTINSWIYQTLPCVELIKTKIHTSTDTILRSKYKIPKLVTGKDGEILSAVTNIAGDTRFSITEFENVKYASGNKFTGNNPRVYFSAQYLWVTKLKQLDAIPIDGIFEDPIEVYQFPNFCEDCTECLCKDVRELEFPIDRNLIMPLVDIANKELVYLLGQMTEDKKNNASDDTSRQMIHQTDQNG